MFKEFSMKSRVVNACKSRLVRGKEIASLVGRAAEAEDWAPFGGNWAAFIRMHTTSDGKKHSWYHMRNMFGSDRIEECSDQRTTHNNGNHSSNNEPTALRRQSRKGIRTCTGCSTMEEQMMR
jgi:hypothetical protein